MHAFQQVRVQWFLHCGQDGSSYCRSIDSHGNAWIAVTDLVKSGYPVAEALAAGRRVPPPRAEWVTSPARSAPASPPTCW